MPADSKREAESTSDIVGRALNAASSHWNTRAWNSAYSNYAAFDKTDKLDAEDLERFGISAYLTDREDEFVDLFERAFDRHCDENQPLRAVRCAFWLGLTLMFRGEFGRGGGWFARAGGVWWRNSATTALKWGIYCCR